MPCCRYASTSQRAAVSMSMPRKSKRPAVIPDDVLYNKNLRAPIHSEINATPKAKVHRVEWNKVMQGDPVEINPSTGHGYKIMTVDEWSARWKRNNDFSKCLQCEGTNTKEHHFIQTWCRKKKKWESELLCLDCHAFSWRSYSDPDFLTPEQYQKQYWQQQAKVNA